MLILRVALGAVADRGATVTPPNLVSLAGPPEQDFLSRHVEKARANSQARSIFIPNSRVPELLATLRADGDAQFVEGASTLQQLLADTMRLSTNASDCVTALVHTLDANSSLEHITVLKLDANVEAARREILDGIVSLTVLTSLLPTPRDLQKALSWPDPRNDSEVLMIDTNGSNAQYFENAFGVRVSPKSAEAEAKLRATIVANVPEQDLAQVLQDASLLEGPADEVLTTLAQDHPSLLPAAQPTDSASRPAGIVRRNKVAALPIIWRADGVELRVPADRASDVVITPGENGYTLSIEVTSPPERGV